MDNLAFDAIIVIESSYYGNYRNHSSDFLYILPHIAHNMRVRTAGSVRGRSSIERDAVIMPSAKEWYRGGIK
jgi:hypothetical protein